METNTIKTTRGELRFRQDFDNYDGCIVYENAQTLDRYRELSDEHPSLISCDCFCAFGQKQFDEGYASLVKKGAIKKGDKVVRSVGGIFGTREGLNRLYAFYEERTKRIAAECDPQEVYFYEWNNHESMINYEGDLEAIRIIINTWGEDAARSIYRIPSRAFCPVDKAFDDEYLKNM